MPEENENKEEEPDSTSGKSIFCYGGGGIPLSNTKVSQTLLNLQKIMG